MSKDIHWVTAYEVTRHYGGPEEGGWWWNRYEPLETQSVRTPEEAERVMQYLQQRFTSRAHGNIYSVLGGVGVLVRTERYCTEGRRLFIGGWDDDEYCEPPDFNRSPAQEEAAAADQDYPEEWYREKEGEY